MSAEITLLSKHGIDPLMSKRIFLDDEGKPKSDGSGCYMAHGAATRRAAASAGALAQIIAECGSNQAIALGSLAAGLPDPATIVSKRSPSYRSRSMPSGPGTPSTTAPGKIRRSGELPQKSQGEGSNRQARFVKRLLN
jgi:hypothetical protein